MSKLPIYSQLGDLTNLEEPPEPKEFFQDVCGPPSLSKIHFLNAQRSTNYCQALSQSRHKFPAVPPKMTSQELRHDMSTFSLQEKDQMNTYDTDKVIDMGDHVLFESLRSKPRALLEKTHIKIEANLNVETIFDHPIVINTELQTYSSAQNSGIFLYEDYKKFIYQQLDMFS
ncbi:YOL024W [Saccharomyces arboricola H-6]|uniref:YOL024W n=1 Tax=Saccharomyces arboricola (strain H-6 / AS 2.3317 / CBS 10644) TaxID=1160507 RepID=J8PI37_SACAR|nr:YOL024W [Saccharomyces arboricola H-6]